MMCELEFLAGNKPIIYNSHLDICDEEIRIIESWRYQTKDWLQAMETIICMKCFKIAIVNQQKQLDQGILLREMDPV